LIPATANADRRVAEAEAYRQKAHSFLTSYVVVVVDNTKGWLEAFVDEVDAKTKGEEFTADRYLPDALAAWHAPRKVVKRSRNENQVEVQVGQWTNAVLTSEYPLTGEPGEVWIDFSDSFVHATKLPGSPDCNHPPPVGK
jgi:hypothetical protein